MKAFGGYDYCSVYKKSQDIDENVITQYQKKEFIPNRRLFWKRYQKEIKMETKAIGEDVLADPLKQRAHLLSLSHKHPEVDELSAISRYIIAKRADIEVEHDPQDTKEEEEKIQTPQPVPPQTPVIDVNHPTPSSGYNQYLSSESFNLSTPTKMPSLSSPDGPPLQPATRSSSVQRKSRFDLTPSSKPDHFPYNNVSSTVSPVHPSAEPRSIPDVAAMTQPSERPPSLSASGNGSFDLSHGRASYSRSSSRSDRGHGSHYSRSSSRSRSGYRRGSLSRDHSRRSSRSYSYSSHSNSRSRSNSHSRSSRSRSYSRSRSRNSSGYRDRSRDRYSRYYNSPSRYYDKYRDERGYSNYRSLHQDNYRSWGYSRDGSRYY